MVYAWRRTTPTRSPERRFTALERCPTIPTVPCHDMGDGVVDTGGLIVAPVPLQTCLSLRLALYKGSLRDL